MYSIELTDLYSDQLQQRVLGMIEEICEEFHFEDHFGTLSFSMHEILDEIIRNCSTEQSYTDLSFYISYKEVAVLIHHSESLLPLRERLNDSQAREESAIFAINQLVDGIEFSNQDQDLSLLFHVKSKSKGVGGETQSSLRNLLVKEEIEEDMRKKRGV
ncbi:MAG: hypothetical protein LBV02_05525 [Bacteroidales bacterium]|jgi:hypothetical protein|nr:hypothetical protein [Bacteroidales bacterium]